MLRSERATMLRYTYIAYLFVIANLPVKSPKNWKPEATLLACAFHVRAAIPVAAMMMYSRLSHAHWNTAARLFSVASSSSAAIL